MGCNLLSVSQLETRGFNVSFDIGIIRISKNGKIIVEGERCGRLYKIKFIVKRDVVNMVENLNSVSVCCRRFYRLGYNGLQNVRNAVIGIEEN